MTLPAGRKRSARRVTADITVPGYGRANLGFSGRGDGATSQLVATNFYVRSVDGLVVANTTLVGNVRLEVFILAYPRQIDWRYEHCCSVFFYNAWGDGLHVA
jgi:hypothetical protein